MLVLILAPVRARKERENVRPGGTPGGWKSETTTQRRPLDAAATPVGNSAWLLRSPRFVFAYGSTTSFSLLPFPIVIRAPALERR